MKKKRSSTETTGPLRIVLFKGSRKPTTFHISERAAVKLYTFVGAVLFFALFITTVLLMLHQEKCRLEDRYITSQNEVERLKHMIRDLKTKSIRAADIINDHEEKTQDNNQRGDKTIGTPLTPSSDVIPSANIITSSPPDRASADENNIAASESNSSVGELSASISGFQTERKDGSANLDFKYWLINKSQGGVRLEGKAVLLFHTENQIITYPWVPLTNGKLESRNRGILFRIQHRKQMTGKVGLPSPTTVIKKVKLILFDLKGNRFLEQEIALTAESADN
jgi:hypothetical protein